LQAGRGTLFEFARSRKYEETAVALSLLSAASLEINQTADEEPHG
jgi:hypothetical protein